MTEKKTAGIGKGTPGPGRPKGVPNKASKELKEMILEALDGVGGVEYLERKANDPKTAGAFLSLIGKVLPMTIQGPGPDGEHQAHVTVRFVSDVRNTDT